MMQRLERVEVLDYNSLEKYPKILMRNRWIARCMGRPEGGFRQISLIRTVDGLRSTFI